MARLICTVTVRKTGKTTQEVIYLITDLTQIQASPRRLLDLGVVIGASKMACITCAMCPLAKIDPICTPILLLKSWPPCAILSAPGKGTLLLDLMD